MKSRTLCLVAIVSCCGLFGSEDIYPTLITGDATVVGSALGRADVALSRSLISPTAFRGSLGENVAGQYFLKNTLSQSGNWQMITPRSGPQGLDHLYIKVNSQGLPNQLLVGESKFNTSRLSETLDGIQMGKRWTNTRLTALGARYISVAGDGNISFARMPLNPNRSIEITLPNGQHRHFWKNSSLDSWKFTGSRDELASARVQASNYGIFFRKAGNDIISYRSRIFNIRPTGNDLKIIVYDAANITKNTSLHDLKQLSIINLKNALAGEKKYSAGIENDIAKVLQKKLNLHDSEALKMAKKICRQYTAKELMKANSLHREIFTSRSLWMGTGIAVLLIGTDVFARWAAAGFEPRSLDIRPVALGGVSTFSSIVIGNYIKAGLTLHGPNNIIRSLSGPLHCSTGTMTTFISSNAAAVLAMAMFNYGMYFMGGIDLQTANRQMIVGAAAVGAGSLFVAGTMSALAWLGTASTGTAIASLSGAAATNASLALLGGSVLLGQVILSGGALLIAVGVTYIGYKLFELKDQHEDNQRIAYLLNFYSNEGNLRLAIPPSMRPRPAKY